MSTAAARLRLFCLPYAGASARIYDGWRRRFPAGVEVVPLELPGRGSRFGVPLLDRADALVDDLLPAVLAHGDDVPIAFFGHSMGAILAFELCRRLERGYGRVPRYLCVSALRAPHLPPDRIPDHTLPDDRFRERLRSFNGTPSEVLADEGLMDLLVPILRADLAVADTYEPPTGATVQCPVVAFGGIEDGEVALTQVAQWAHATTGPFAVTPLPGDHFFLHTEEDRLLGEISRRVLPGPPGEPAAHSA